MDGAVSEEEIGAAMCTLQKWKMEQSFLLVVDQT